MKFYNNISENLFTRVTISFFFFIVSIVGTFVNHAVIILHNDFCHHLAVLFFFTYTFSSYTRRHTKQHSYYRT